MIFFHLLDSAKMPNLSGHYRALALDQAGFLDELQAAHQNDALLSRVRCTKCLAFIREHTGLEIEVTQPEEKVVDGDFLLMMQSGDDGFEFGISYYKAKPFYSDEPD